VWQGSPTHVCEVTGGADFDAGTKAVTCLFSVLFVSVTQAGARVSDPVPGLRQRFERNDLMRSNQKLPRGGFWPDGGQDDTPGEVCPGFSSPGVEVVPRYLNECRSRLH